MTVTALDKLRDIAARPPTAYGPEIQQAISELEKYSQAEKILLACTTQYYVASGLVPIDGQDGYGPLRDARIFIEAFGSAASKTELDKFRKR
jgi:hypothetical protein